MSKVQILVATMHQTDLSKYYSMNIQTDMLIANQSDKYSYMKEIKDGNVVQMITTETRGTSRNRNIALTASSNEAEYIMFCDDDIILVDNYEKLVCDEFSAHPEADAIMFNIDTIAGREFKMKKTTQFKKAARTDVTSAGVHGLVLKREVVLKKNIRFNEYFGPGTENYCGEDSIFLQDILKSKMDLYLSPQKIADVDQSESTWFEGRTEKYFVTAGKVFAAIYPGIARLLAIRSAYRFSKRSDTNMSFKDILSCYLKGIDEYLKK